MPGPIGLMDYVPSSELVAVGKDKQGNDQHVEVFGWTVFDFASIIKRWPDLKQFFQREGLTIEQALDIAPTSIAGLIAIACGKSGDEAAEFKASRMPVQIQMSILKAAAKLTFTEGFGPFVQQMADLGLLTDRVGRAPPTRSSSPSMNSSEQDIAKTLS